MSPVKRKLSSPVVEAQHEARVVHVAVPVRDRADELEDGPAERELRAQGRDGYLSPSSAAVSSKWVKLPEESNSV